MTPVDKHKFGPWTIVTGASSGIGKEFARQLAASGLNLVLVARRLVLLEALGQQLAKEYGIQYRAVGVDLSEGTFLGKIAPVLEKLDIGLLISNAGTGLPNEFLTADVNTLHNVVRLNIISHLQLIRYLGQKLARRGRGGVLLVSALGAAEGIPYM